MKPAILQLASDPEVKAALAQIPRVIESPVRRAARMFNPEFSAHCCESALRRWSKAAERKKMSEAARRRAATPKGKALLDTARRHSISSRSKR